MAEETFEAPRIARKKQARVAAFGLNTIRPMLKFQISLFRLWANVLGLVAPKDAFVLRYGPLGIGRERHRDVHAQLRERRRKFQTAVA
jgi:hypothetical protein